MTTMLRTPSVSYNALYGGSPNTDLFTTAAFFDITLPSDYTTGMPIAFTVVGGCVSDGAAPTSFTYHCEVSLWGVSGGSFLSATLDSHGYGVLVGADVAYYNTIAGTAQTTTGTSVTLLNDNFTAPLTYQHGVLQDGTTVGFPGEGFAENTAWSNYSGPQGWYPSFEAINPTISGTDPFSPNQVITAELNIDLDVEDNVNPDRSIYCVIQSVTVQIGAHAPQSIDITAVKVGWSTGVAYTAGEALGGVSATTAVHTNPRRTVDSNNPVNFPNLQQKEDFYLTSTSSPVGKVITTDCAKVIVTGANADGSYTGIVVGTLDVIPDDPNNTPMPVLPGNWELATPTDTVTGLDHLEGLSVMAVADGNVEGPYTVVDGSITLGAPASSYVVGLPYTSQIQTLYLTVEGIQPGTIQGKMKFLPEVVLRTDCTRGLKVGHDFASLTEAPDLNGVGLELFTGDARTNIGPGWDEKGEIVIQQDQPLPASVLGVIVGVVPGDTGR